MDKNRKMDSEIFLHEHMNKVQVVYTPGNLDQFLTGLATQPAQKMDHYFTEQVYPGAFLHIAFIKHGYSNQILE